MSDLVEAAMKWLASDAPKEPITIDGETRAKIVSMLANYLADHEVRERVLDTHFHRSEVIRKVLAQLIPEHSK